MGLWDKVKGAVRTMTGGGATITLSVGEATLGSPFVVRVSATANADIDVSAIYVQLRAVEHAEVRDVDYDYGEGRQRIEYVEGTHTTYTEKFVIGDKVALQEGQTMTWEGEITVPDSANPSFDGHMISHQWTILGALDCFGNDPDTGWQTFQMWDN